ncbi:endopeptidase La [Alphaproteobacteria bacterium endosymbiont of Tiliacea citrago]|uniref:endopeptidase La n=1 Tax=Alphaproteobacteria bacterium endosymbiont of Tiliacea citrago TaxID=3077944 RepID=UPI00313CEBED
MKKRIQKFSSTSSLKNEKAKILAQEADINMKNEIGVENIEFFEKLKDKGVKLPLLPLKDMSPFPYMVMSIFVGREKSVKAVEAANSSSGELFLVAQKQSETEEVEKEDVEEYGVVAEIKQIVLLQDRTLKVLFECKYVASLLSMEDSEECGIEASVQESYKVYSISSEEEREALKKTLKESFEKFLKLSKAFDISMISFVNGIEDSFEFAYYIAERLSLSALENQKILSIRDEHELLDYLIIKAESLMKIIEIERKIKSRLKNQIEKNQKDYYLTEQMKAIQKELGEGEDYKEDLNKIEKKINEVKLSDHAKETALSEFKKLKYMSQFSAEFSVIKNYLDFLLALPWKIHSESNKHLEEIKSILNESHYGIQDVKDRVYELILQKNRVKDQKKSTVLCFYGAPGIGKTSFAYAIGKAMGLKTVSIPLGGVKDESALRGHRRTYIGSMPGKILQAMKDAGTSNLVIVLDEIGSMGSDWRGSPEDVLLEILDPIQNKNFQDNYLGTGFDLSGVIFVATTNYIDRIKPALLDRLEVIHLTGYTQEEKELIANNYIIPKLLEEYGLTKEEFQIDKEKLNKVIRNYTYESGVRGLEKQLSKLIRKAMCRIEEKKEEKVEIDDEKIKTFLKKPVYLPEEKKESRIGVVNGLAYVSSREGQEGEVLTIESILVPGEGKVEFTGNLGNMMKESIQIAYKKLLSKSEEYGLNLEELKKKNMYINFPSGGTPKDGPSAGVAIFCSIFSTLKNKKFPTDIAMTGEISLYDALKVGGIKEKLLAAYRNGIKKVFIPNDNKVDLEDISEIILKDIEVILIKRPEEVLENLGLLK